MTNTTTPNVPLDALTPQFDLPQHIFDDLHAPTTQPNNTLAMFGQTRFLQSLPLALATQQSLYIADFTGFERQHLQAAFDTHLADIPYVYLDGQLRRQQLFGQITAQENKLGLLGQEICLVICAESLLKKEMLWELLCDALSQGEFMLGRETHRIKAQVHLVGFVHYYAELLDHDRRFNQLFPLLAELTPEYHCQQQAITDYVTWLTRLAQTHSLSLSQEAYPALLNFCASITEHQQRLTLRSLEISQLLLQAHYFAHSSHIDADAIKQALDAKQQRHNSAEEYGLQSFQDGFVNVATQGQVVGQINGLTVIDSADYSYGETARITATIHYGEGDIGDVERKAELGGNIHAKGMMILTACLYQVFGRDEPLHFNANIVFEQSYQEIDGDSASMAEYCCLLSAIAEQPIDQALAVTGALDQLGNVQAIGGVNEKINGFYQLCKHQGLTGEQGVIIPSANVLQLNLSQEIVEAITQGQFHLYHVDHIEQAIPLLMGIEAGEPNQEDQFPENSLYYLIQQRLDKLAGHDDLPLTFWQKIKQKLNLAD